MTFDKWYEKGNFAWVGYQSQITSIDLKDIARQAWEVGAKSAVKPVVIRQSKPKGRLGCVDI